MLDKFLSHGDWDLEIIAVVIFLLVFVLNASAWLVQRYKVGTSGHVAMCHVACDNICLPNMHGMLLASPHIIYHVPFFIRSWFSVMHNEAR